MTFSMLLGILQSLERKWEGISGKIKKTFLAIHTWELATAAQRGRLEELASSNDASKVSEVLSIMKACGVDEWAKQLKEEYFKKAMFHLEEIAVMSRRKVALSELAEFLLQREH